MYNFFAFDIGATSGRSIYGTIDNGKLEMRQLTRFQNKIYRFNRKYYWNIFLLFDELKKGLKILVSEGLKIDAIGINTWGVDFVYLGADGEILGHPRSYRDPYTNGMPEALSSILPKDELYKMTGIQILNFNSLFQLFAAKKEKSAILRASTDLLFIPDALSYMLTGVKVCEYTIASTSQILNPYTKQFESNLLDTIGVSPSLFQPIVMPGEIIGYVTEDIMQECGIDRVPVIAVAGHDTASAVAAIPVKDKNFAYLSSGTWSLMGIEVSEPIISKESFKNNFTNEGGVDGTIRFLKNITGMWILEQCRKEWEASGRSYDYSEIVTMLNAETSSIALIDPDHESFACPTSMCDAIAAFCASTNQPVPLTDEAYIQCIFYSLVLKYRTVLNLLREVSPHPIEKLHIIGGGSMNTSFNQMTADCLGIPVIAGPVEATIVGNIMIQARGLGIVDTLEDMREIIKQSIETKTYIPQNNFDWNQLYEKFKNIK